MQYIGKEVKITFCVLNPEATQSYIKTVLKLVACFHKIKQQFLGFRWEEE